MTDVFTPSTQIAETYEAMRGFADKLNALIGEEVLGPVCRDFARNELANDARMELIFQLLTATADSPDTLGVEVKHDAVQLAETLGPDWCQWLYRFAVLCTKLA